MISICIPTYEQHGHGTDMLQRLFKSIQIQTLKNFEVCVSDNSKDGRIEELCQLWMKEFQIKYKRNEVVGAAANTNAAIDMARYDKIKIMYQDDIFGKHIALEFFSRALDSDRGWVISDSKHIDENDKTIYLKRVNYRHDQFEKNITGMPSVIAFKKNELRFRTDLPTFFDMYFYYQLYEKFGKPRILRGYLISQRFWHGSHSNNMEKTPDKDREFLRLNKLIRC